MKMKKLLAMVVALALFVTMLPLTVAAGEEPWADVEYSAAGSRVTKVDPLQPDPGKPAEFSLSFRDRNGSLITNEVVMFYVESSRDAEVLTLRDGAVGEVIAKNESKWQVYARTDGSGRAWFQIKSSVPGEVTIKVARDQDIKTLLTDGEKKLVIGKADATDIELTLEDETYNSAKSRYEVTAGKRFTLVATVEAGQFPVEKQDVTFSESYKGGRFQNIGTVKTDSDGVAKLRVTRDKAGAYEFKAKAGSLETKPAVKVEVLPAQPYSIKADKTSIHVEKDKTAKPVFILRDRYDNKLEADKVAHLGGISKVLDAEVTGPDDKKLVKNKDFWVEADGSDFVVRFQGKDTGKYLVEASVAGTSISAVSQVYVGKFDQVEKIEVEAEDTVIRAEGTTVVTAYLIDGKGIKREAKEEDREVVFSSSNVTIARVGQYSGEVTGRKDASGQVTITALHPDTGLEARVKITVSGEPVGLEVETKVTDLKADVTLTFVDEKGFQALPDEDEDGYQVIVPAGVTLKERQDFEDGLATFKLEAKDYGTYSIRVVTDQGIAKTFSVKFAKEPVHTGARKVTLNIGSTVGIVDGKSQVLDVAPFIAASRTYVPVRFIAEAFGAEADWEPKPGPTETVYLTREDVQIVIGIGDNFLTVTRDGESTVETFDGSARIVNSRTFLPFRAIAEAFGAEVDFGTGPDGRVTWVSFEQR